MKVRLLFLLLLILFVSTFVSSQPSGANITSFSPSTSNLTSIPGNDSNSYAGNITSLVVYGNSLTQTWQGYFGNVTGNVQLADASNYILYNWSSISSQGEVYSSTNNTISWTNVQCFNFTANGTISTSGGAETPGQTNLGGRNLTQLEQQYGLSPNDGDGVDETFSLGGTLSHNSFFVGNINFAAGICPSTAIFDSTGSSVDGEFEEVLLYEPATTSLIFASLMENDLSGFDSNQHDFEMLVLDDGHDGDTDATNYYFYVEIG